MDSFHRSLSCYIFLAMTSSQSWIPAVAGVVGSIAVVTVVCVGVACYIKRRRNNTERCKELSV